MFSYIRRIALFLILNFVIVITISFILNVLGVKPYLSKQGLDLTHLAIFCFVWGMVGALISLALSKQMAKWMMGVRTIQPNTTDPQLYFVYEIVERQSRILGIKMPEVGVFETSIVNAFATGPSKSHSLVAVSRGLLNQLSHAEIEAVIGHEMSHIANGDMVTMTLLQGVINAFVMFLARVLAMVISGLGKSRDSKDNYGSYYALTFLFEIIFMILGSLVVAAYSRFREYRADLGGAVLSSKRQMIGALQALERVHDKALPEGAAKSLNAFMIRGNESTLMRLFSTHPPIAKRIERLNQHLEVQ
jgi:heat shock protein HtpX